jgi:hypothetical protein
LGEMRFFFGPRGEIAPALCHQPRSAHLRPDAREGVADLSPTEELLAEVSFLREEEVTCTLFGDLAYHSEQLEEELAESGILLVNGRATQQRGARQQIEIPFASLKRFLVSARR